MGGDYDININYGIHFLPYFSGALGNILHTTPLSNLCPHNFVRQISLRENNWPKVTQPVSGLSKNPKNTGLLQPHTNIRTTTKPQSLTSKWPPSYWNLHNLHWLTDNVFLLQNSPNCTSNLKSLLRGTSNNMRTSVKQHIVERGKLHSNLQDQIWSWGTTLEATWRLGKIVIHFLKAIETPCHHILRKRDLC